MYILYSLTKSMFSFLYPRQSSSAFVKESTWLCVPKLKPLISPVCHLQIKGVLQLETVQCAPGAGTKLSLRSLYLCTKGEN